jgi:hypothetical protein
MGWHCDYVCRLLNTYHQYTLEYILYDLSMLDGFVLYSWAYANNPLHMFNGIQMVNSYATQEADNLLMELKEMKSKQGTK